MEPAEVEPMELSSIREVIFQENLKALENIE